MNIESSLYSISLAPKLASEIKKYTEHKNQLTGENKIDYVANTVAHAILGAVVAQLQGNSAIVGGLGAAYSERGAEIIAKILYPDKAIDKLSQEEKQQVSALAQLATGLTTAALGGDAQDINTAMAGGKNAIENNLIATLPIRACAIATPCRGFIAKKILEHGIKAGITAIVAKEISDNISSEDLDHLITLWMWGHDDITSHYLEELKDKYATTIAVDPNDERFKTPEGYPIPENNNKPPLITPIHEQDKDAGKLVTPVVEIDKNGGIYTGPEIDIGDWRDFILTNQDKSFVDYKGDLNKGDQIDLSKFTVRQKVSGGKANYVDPKTGWILSPDRAGANSHGGSAWKLTDKKGNRIATLDENGNVLRK